MESTNTYKETFKATSLFGGIQVFNILVSFFRSKVIAVFLGIGGYGINGLLQSGMDLVGTITGLGIGFGGIKDIAEANSEGNTEKTSKIAATIKRWSLWTGIGGVLVVIFFSPLLSKWLVENVENGAGLGKYDYTWTFVALSISVFFVAVSNGQQALLRGFRRLKDTAKTGFYSALAGLIVSIPFYYFYGINGIAPTIILTALMMLVFSWYYSKKIEFVPVDITYKESFFQGKKMITLGVFMTLSSLAGQLLAYLTTLYILNQSGKEAVGLYNAGWSMTNRYVGLVFTAMLVDYFPRLVNLQNNRDGMTEAVNQQGEIAILIIAPLMILYLTLLPALLRLLLSSDFMPIIDFVQWTILGIMFKTASWALNSIIVAKGDNKLFLVSELVSNSIFLVLNIAGYCLYGLMGVGIAFSINYLLYFIAMFLLAKKKYGITFNKDFNKMFLYQFILSIICFLVIYVKGHPFAYIPCFILFIVSSVYSYKKLNEKIGLWKLVISKLRRR
ncbi:O-antigen translocase [Bacteroidia bacterium]|nr:O-antigen translocase [Bacteroidia bacterium]GHV30762.1 O-antigen translocase [Bacteroidia bacterium]